MTNCGTSDLDGDEELSWTFALTGPDVWKRPSDVDSRAEFLPAPVPGTVAAALREAGRFDFGDPLDLDRFDAWYRARLTGAGRRRLFFGGLATRSEVYLGETPLLESRSMFIEHQADCDPAGDAWLWIVFRALGPLLDKARPRARWRPRTIVPPSLRFFRTTLLGRMPGWQPPVHAVGPWRPITVKRMGSAPRLAAADLRAGVDGLAGILEVELRIENDDGAVARLSCAEREMTLERIKPGCLRGRLVVDAVKPWFPHTHGNPYLYDVEARLGDRTWALGRVGFRRIALDRGDGSGFGLVINDEPVFCRGAVWTTADLVSLPCSRDAYRPLLMAMREANLNMVRISGATAYEAKPFFDLCDELGLLVWQDFMFSNFDYPSEDADFVALVRREAEQILGGIGPAPSLAVLCGGSEMAQQAAMFGLPQSHWSSPLFDQVLREIAVGARPDCVYVPQTPCGGDLPFEPATGICHYYGVSAYMRAPEDARRAEVRFSAESLGHATPSDVEPPRPTLAGPRIDQPCWGARHADDSGAIWFFEDVRNHYIRTLYGLDATQLAALDAERYLDFSRAANAELFEEVFALWRRRGSPTRGALIWCWRDVFPCAGWGMLDSSGQPKSVWFALRRACRPLQVLLTDEGLGGLRVHVLNETDRPVEAHVSLVCLREGRTPVARADRSLRLAARSVASFSDAQLFGAFFDAAYAYRFGPPAHDVTVAALRLGADAPPISQAFHFPLGRGCVRAPLGLEAKLEADAEGWTLLVGAGRFAQSVHIDDSVFRAEDDWMHLPPGAPRKLRLIPRRAGEERTPNGAVRALNGVDCVHYGTAS